MTYVAYTLDPTTREFFHSDYLWLTLPFTVFGLLRFLYLVSGRAGRGLKAESPTQEMLRDVPFVLNIFDLQHRLQPWFPEVSGGGQWEHREAVWADGCRRAARVTRPS